MMVFFGDKKYSAHNKIDVTAILIMLSPNGFINPPFIIYFIAV